MSRERLDREIDAIVQRRLAGRDEGRTQAIARQHALGKQTARERIAILLDAGSFREVGALVEPSRETFDTEDLEAPGDGVITGYGRIDGRNVAICAFDFTILGGSNGERGELKIVRVAEQCLQHGYPFVMLLDGGGHRIQEGLDSRHFARGTSLFQYITKLSGWVPMAAAMMGPGFAGPSNFASLADYTVMVAGTSTMGIAGPALVKAATGETVSKEDLGGAAIQADTAGVADAVAATEEEALASLKKFLSYLPSCASQTPPVGPIEDPLDRREELLLTIVPDNSRRAYDMRKVVTAVADVGSVFELKATYSKSLITAFGRLGGRPVGFIANQPMHTGGALTSGACEKGAHFVAMCDAFGLALVYLIDVPGFMVGTSSEKTGLVRRSAKLVYELGQATVPRVSVVLRKGYGQAYVAMAGGRSFDADLCVAWPMAEICAMSVEGAVDVAYRKAIEAASDPAAHRSTLIDRFRSQLGSLRAVEAFGVDDVIDPRDTRGLIIETLQRVGNRKIGTAAPPKKRGIAPV